MAQRMNNPRYFYAYCRCSNGFCSLASSLEDARVKLEKHESMYHGRKFVGTMGASIDYPYWLNIKEVNG
jgi:hypothetical protein